MCSRSMLLAMSSISREMINHKVRAPGTLSTLTLSGPSPGDPRMLPLRFLFQELEQGGRELSPEPSPYQQAGRMDSLRIPHGGFYLLFAYLFLNLFLEEEEVYQIYQHPEYLG